MNKRNILKYLNKNKYNSSYNCYYIIDDDIILTDGYSIVAYTEHTAEVEQFLNKIGICKNTNGFYYSLKNIYTDLKHFKDMNIKIDLNNKDNNGYILTENNKICFDSKRLKMGIDLLNYNNNIAFYDGEHFLNINGTAARYFLLGVKK